LLFGGSQIINLEQAKYHDGMPGRPLFFKIGHYRMFQAETATGFAVNSEKEITVNVGLELLIPALGNTT
jgi:hypothetical protein